LDLKKGKLKIKENSGILISNSIVYFYAMQGDVTGLGFKSSESRIFSFIKLIGGILVQM